MEPYWTHEQMILNVKLTTFCFCFFCSKTKQEKRKPARKESLQVVVWKQRWGMTLSLTLVATLKTMKTSCDIGSYSTALFPSNPRNAAVPSHAVQCHPGKPELCVAPYILLQWPEELYQGASSLTNSLCSYIWNGLFSVLFSLQLTLKLDHITLLHQLLFVG